MRPHRRRPFSGGGGLPPRGGRRPRWPDRGGAGPRHGGDVGHARRAGRHRGGVPEGRPRLRRLGGPRRRRRRRGGRPPFRCCVDASLRQARDPGRAALGLQPSEGRVERRELLAREVRLRAAHYVAGHPGGGGRRGRRARRRRLSHLVHVAQHHDEQVDTRHQGRILERVPQSGQRGHGPAPRVHAVRPGLEGPQALLAGRWGLRRRAARDAHGGRGRPAARRLGQRRLGGDALVGEELRLWLRGQGVRGAAAG
mmetsp:Transcript_32653/g.98683  ORF Transcript_32653/g.98683 Transcript_32653/m.98683 type:complete len:254 (-) Transcript_32653:182-943(-)